MAKVASIFAGRDNGTLRENSRINCLAAWRSGSLNEDSLRWYWPRMSHADLPEEFLEYVASVTGRTREEVEKNAAEIDKKRATAAK